MSRKTKIVVAIAAVIAVAAIAFFGVRNQMQANATSGTAKVGVILPLTGPLAAEGERMLAAVKLSEKRQASSKPSVQFLVEDGKYTVKDSINAFVKLKSQKVCGWIVYADLPLMGMKQILIEDGKPTICLIGDQKLIKGLDRFIHLSGAIIVPAQKNAEYALKHNLKTAVVVFPDEDYGKNVAAAFTSKYQGGGGKVVLSEGFLPGQVDAKSLVAKAIKTKADVFFLCGYGPAFVAIVNQLKQQKFPGMILADTNVCVEKKNLIDGGEGIVYADFDFGDGCTNPATKEFVDSVRRDYGVGASSFSAFIYEAANLLAKSIKTVGTDPDKICENICSVKNYPSVIGKLSCGKDQELDVPIIMKKSLKNGAEILE